MIFHIMKQKYSEEVAKLDQATLTSTPIPQLSLQKKLSLNEAYEIQAKCIATRLDRGEAVTGIKLGFTSKAKMQQMGVNDLIMGRLTDKMEITNGGTMSIANYIHPRGEPEIAFKLGKDINGLLPLDKATNHLSGVAVAMEIIDSRYEDFKFSLEDVVADNCSSASYVVGDWKDPNTKVSDVKMEITSDDEIAESGNSNAILGNPLMSLVETARLANDFSIPLRKGMIILAGAATSAIFLKKGTCVEVNAEHLGSVYLEVK